jgi:hypothetical protein
MLFMMQSFIEYTFTNAVITADPILVSQLPYLLGHKILLTDKIPLIIR